MIDPFQYYPTPPSLAARAWALFQNKSITRLLEPSAGQGHLVRFLIDQHPSFDQIRNKTYPYPYLGNHEKWSAIEINPEFHPLLREMKANVVGYDFLSFSEGARFSHIIMNPPFAQGATHLLHAWDILFNGEIVAIINAETLRNPFSKERQLLVKIIEQNGSVEFIDQAFTSEDTLRQTSVEIALVYLKKENRDSTQLLDYIHELEKKEADTLKAVQFNAELMLPLNVIDNTIANYNLTVSAALEARAALNKLKVYKSRLGSVNGESQTGDCETDTKDLLAHFDSVEMEQIHRTAWHGIVSHCIKTHALPRNTAKQVESQLESIYELAFNATNIYGFICGIQEQRGAIQTDMILEVFDDITRYHSENTCFYMGWKSNDKHRTMGKSIKLSRFILPLMGSSGWSAESRAIKILQDIDNTFLSLSEETGYEISLVEAFTNEQIRRKLEQGERIKTDFFDLRYYPGRGTMHFFPRRADLVQRLNLFAGKQRQWLPEDMSQASDSFSRQFEQAEKISKKIDLAKVLKSKDPYFINRAIVLEDRRDMEALHSALCDAQAACDITPLLEESEFLREPIAMLGAV